MIWRQEFCATASKNHDVSGLKWKYLYVTLRREDSDAYNEVKSYHLVQEGSTAAVCAGVCVSREGYTELGTLAASGPLKGGEYFMVPFVLFKL